MAEREFKVGDLVRVKSGESAGCKFYEDNCGVVRHVGTETCSVDFFRGRVDEAYGHDCRLGNEIIPDKTGWNCYTKDLELYAAGVIEYKGFRVGDRVKTITQDSMRDVGFTGTVVGIDSILDCPICVRFDKSYKLRHGCCLGGILSEDSEQGAFEYTTDIKVIRPILGYIPEPEKPAPAEVKKYTDTAQVVIEKIRNLLTF